MPKYLVSFLKVTEIAQTEVEAENENVARQEAAKKNEDGKLEYRPEEIYIISLEEASEVKESQDV